MRMRAPWGWLHEFDMDGAAPGSCAAAGCVPAETDLEPTTEPNTAITLTVITNDADLEEMD